MNFSRVEDFIFEKMSKSKLPGLSAAAVGGGDVVWAKGFGFRDLERGFTATPKTLFAIASVTKSFTCIAILQLVEQGKLDLEDPVGDHVPEWVQAGDQPIKIWHLMSHSSGIPALAYAECVIRGVIGAGEEWLPIASYADMLTFLREARDWTIAKPGQRWFYLNEGYVLLGTIIEKCSGMPYVDYVKERIFAPLGMKRSFFAKEDVEADPDVATPYIITRDDERLASRYAYGGITADGGIISNAQDLAKYLLMFLREGEGVLTPESVEEMQTARVRTPWKGPFGEAGYGLGLGIAPEFLGYRLISHGGNVGVATAYIGFIPEKKVGVALVANADGYPLKHMGMYALAAMIEQDPEMLPFVQRERRLEELEGTYETYKGTMRVQVRRSGDFLTLEMKDKFTDSVVPLVPLDLGEDTRSFYTWKDGHKLEVTFKVEEERIEGVYERYLIRRTGDL
jgi:CubicO group peptidase (beta-lactamase class C family)